MFDHFSPHFLPLNKVVAFLFWTRFNGFFIKENKTNKIIQKLKVEANQNVTMVVVYDNERYAITCVSTLTNYPRE